MKLLMIESFALDAPIWYFTSVSHAARYFNSQFSAIDVAIKKRNGLYKYHKLEWIEDDNILSKYINPDEKGITIRDYENKTNY